MTDMSRNHVGRHVRSRSAWREAGYVIVALAISVAVVAAIGAVWFVLAPLIAVAVLGVLGAALIAVVRGLRDRSRA